MTDTADGATPELTPLTADGGLALGGVDGTGPGSTTGTDGAGDADAAPTLHPTPGDLGDLAPEQLALTGQWTALAALAHHTGTEESGLLALRELARHADTPDVFRWLWAVLADRPREAWGELSHLPGGLRVPADLVDAVAAEIISPPPQRHRRPHGHADLLHAMDPDDEGTARIAWAVLGPETSPDESVVDAAVRLLGASRVPEVRSRVLAAAAAAARAEPPLTQRRAELLAALAPPLSPAEATAAFDAVQALTEERSSVPAWERFDEPRLWTLLRRLMQHLPPDLLRQALTGAWLDEQDVAARVLTPGYLASLGQPRLTGLLEAGTSLAGPARDALTTALPEMRDLMADPATIELVEHAHRVLPPNVLAGLRNRLTDEAGSAAIFAQAVGDAASRQHRMWTVLALQRAALVSPPGWSPAMAEQAMTGQAYADDQTLRSLAELAEPADRSQVPVAEQEHLTLTAWTAALQPGEFSQVVQSGLAHPQLARLGAAAGLLVLRGQRAADRSDDYPLSAICDDISQVVQALDDERLAWVMGGYFTVATSITPVLEAALLAGPVSTRVAARNAPAATAGLLVMGGVNGTRMSLPPERDLDVLEASAGHSQLESITALARALDWAALEKAGLLARAATSLAGHPTHLEQALAVALDSQKGPARRRASPAQLEVLVREHLAASASGQATDPTAMIAQLLRVSSPALRDLAAQWMTQAPLTDPLLALVVQADEGSAAQPSRYADARAAIGAGQARLVLDEDHDDEAHVAALRRATSADPAQARQAALAVIADAGLDLRQAAAEVLAATPGNAAEAPLIQRLITEEEHADVALLLRQAQRCLASGTLGEALANLVQLVGASPALADLDTAVCLPYAQWHETFRTRVDRARSATTEGTESRLNTLVLLSDLLADQAIAATYLASANPREQEKGRLISENAHGRADAGALAWDGALRQKLPWLPAWAGLRAERVAHPAPLGDTAHRDISEADVQAALVALRRVSEGWVRAMYVTAGTPFPLDEA